MKNLILASASPRRRELLRLFGIPFTVRVADIAEAMAGGNWFDEVSDNEESDEIVVVDGYYSVEDTFAVLLSNEECFKIVKGWLMSIGNLTVASMLTTLRDMMGFMKITESTSLMGGGVGPKELAQLNRLLSRVKK